MLSCTRREEGGEGRAERGVDRGGEMEGEKVVDGETESDRGSGSTIFLPRQ